MAINSAAQTETLLRCRGIRKIFASRGRSTIVLNGVDLDLHPGEVVLISGRSGAGKSTLVSLIGGLDRADQGSVSLGDSRYEEMSNSQLARLRRDKIGIVFQNYNLLPSWTALENVEAALADQGRGRRNQAAALLEQLGLAGRLENLPAELSAGEQQRVALARALANNPTLILADEPTADVDPETAREIVARLITPVGEKRAALLVASHGAFPPSEAHTIYVLQNGKLIRE